MKKVFQIDVSNKTRERQIDSIKNEKIKKYIKKKKKKNYLKGSMLVFDCKFGQTKRRCKSYKFCRCYKKC